MTLWDLAILIGKEYETLYAMGKNLNDEEKGAWTRQHTKIRNLKDIYKSYRKGKKMKKEEQQSIIIRENIESYSQQ